MANLLHRLFRSRRAAPEEAAQVPEQAEAPSAPADPEAAAGPPEERAEQPEDDPSRFEAKPRSGRGRRKSSDEISSIGPGEP